jgi:hypothetical protein
MIGYHLGTRKLDDGRQICDKEVQYSEKIFRCTIKKGFAV